MSVLMYQDQDSKIREYVLKKKQQRERANQLRQLRRNKEYLTEQEAVNPHKRHRKKSASPFASIPNENNNHSNIAVKSQLNHPPNRNRSNDPNTHKLFTMVTDCQEHINSLQSQINDLQLEIKELKRQRQQYNPSPQNHFQPEPMQRRRDTHSTASSSHRSSMQDESTHNPNRKTTNMSKSLANLKLRKRRNSIGKSTNNKPQGNQTQHRNGSTLSHSESAQDFVNKLSEMGNTVEDVHRVPCHQCGRKFIESALQRHIKICKNVFCKKRKVFDTKSRRVDKDAKNAQNSSSENDYKLKKIRNKKKASWKAKSAMLRQAIAASKGPNNDVGYGGMGGTMSSSHAYDDRVECPHCGRRFAENTAERHIPKCRDIISKPKTLRRKMSYY
eukprot:654469_1